MDRALRPGAGARRPGLAWSQAQGWGRGFDR
jgi:hypothetical protein